MQMTHDVDDEESCNGFIWRKRKKQRFDLIKAN